MKMKKSGYPCFNIPLLIGIHDFEQYYKDIFRKCFIHAHKHLDWASTYIPYWKKLAQNDFDYRVAISGYAAGIEYNGEVALDVKLSIYDETFKKLEVTEKTELDIDLYYTEEIEGIIKKWTDSQKYINGNPHILEPGEKKYSVLWKCIKKKFIIKVKEMGIFRFIPWFFGWMIKHLGIKICNIFECQK